MQAEEAQNKGISGPIKMTDVLQVSFKKKTNMEAISLVNGYFDFSNYNMWPQIWENNFVYILSAT